MYKIISTPQGPRVPGPMRHASSAVLDQQFNKEEFNDKMGLVIRYKQTSTENSWPNVGDKLKGTVIFPNQQYKDAFWKHHTSTQEENKTSTPQEKRRKVNDLSQSTINDFFRPSLETKLAQLIRENDKVQERIRILSEAQTSDTNPYTPLKARAREQQEALLQKILDEKQKEIESILRQQENVNPNEPNI